MRLSRRKAMGAMAGGAVAGPSVMKYAAERVNTSLPGGYMASPGTQYDSPSELKQPSLADPENNLKYLQDIAAGRFPESYLDDWHRDHKHSLSMDNLHSLKSVSPAGRALILQQQRVEERKRDAIKNALERIPYVKEMIAKLSPLGIKF